MRHTLNAVFDERSDTQHVLDPPTGMYRNRSWDEVESSLKERLGQVYPGTRLKSDLVFVSLGAQPGPEADVVT
jgi:hypothetical protein